MEIEYTKDAEENMLFWIKSGNKKVLKKIQLLVEDIKKTPFSGIGKPEPLKYKHQGKWSRRIDLEHRLIYEFFERKNKIYIYSLKGHYKD
jgi:toxin YoeB